MDGDMVLVTERDGLGLIRSWVMRRDNGHWYSYGSHGRGDLYLTDGRIEELIQWSGIDSARTYERIVRDTSEGR